MTAGIDPAANAAGSLLDVCAHLTGVQILTPQPAGAPTFANHYADLADGVAEGNPFATPPTLGNAAMLQPYLQPIFSIDAGSCAR